MLPVFLALIKHKKHHLPAPLVKKSPILHENLVIRTISHVKWVVFYQWGQKMALFRFDQRQSHW